MSLKFSDRVFETSNTTGTGTLDLLGAVTGFRAFSGAFATSDKVAYIINDTSNWEVGIGTIVVGNKLARTTILASSNANAAVNWGAGTRNVRHGPIAGLAANKDENLNLIEGYGTGGGTANAHTVTMPITPLAYSDGMLVSYFASVANTGAMTINVNGLGNKSLKSNGSDLFGGAVKIGTHVMARYSVAAGWFELASNAGSGLNMSVENFTGNGATTNFTLANNPGSQNNVWLSIGGVEQNNADFALSGLDIIPNIIVPNNVPVRVRYGYQAGVLAPTDGSVTIPKLAAGVYASQAQAEAGAENTLLITALRVRQAIVAFFAGSLFRGYRRVATYDLAGLSTLDITGLVAGRHYQLRHAGIYASVAGDLGFYTSTDNGASFNNTAANYIGQQDNSAGATNASGAYSLNHMQCSVGGFGTIAAQTGQGIVDIYDPNNAAYKTTTICHGLGNSAGTVRRYSIVGQRILAEANNAIRVFPNGGGSFTAGRLELWEAMA